MQTDVLIIGCGIAGATAALELAEDRERAITIITREREPALCASAWAQGGIVGRGRDDTPELLVQNILASGAGLSLPRAARLLAEEGPPLLERILHREAGVTFDHDARNEPEFALEAAHSRRRILHVGDHTGAAIMSGLLAALRERPNVRLLRQHTAVDLLTFPHHAPGPLAVYDLPICHGAYVLDRERGEVSPIVAAHTVLATGGLGQIYLNTTNPPHAWGDGLAMAYRAGARVINAEQVQFHPTALHMPGPTKGLISEAVRGEGGVLLTPDGERFMERHAPGTLELATRDVVARAIYREMVDRDLSYVLLDIAGHRKAGEIRARFPSIHALCLAHNIDMTRQPIPVVPAAHYFCGGVLVDLDGRTTLEGLYAVGEVSCTGVHGANRLASTSLLEGLVWGSRAARHIRARGRVPAPREHDVPVWDVSALTDAADPALIQADLETVRNVMWHYVGLIRNEVRLVRAVRDLRRLWFSIEEFYRRAHLTDALVGLRNAVLNSVIVAQAALHNTTSRGCHFREDGRPERLAAPPNEANPLDPERSG